MKRTYEHLAGIAMTAQDRQLKTACETCKLLVTENQPHPALKKISALKGSELYKCRLCYSYLHKQGQSWEMICANIAPSQSTHLHSKAYIDNRQTAHNRSKQI